MHYFTFLYVTLRYFTLRYVTLRDTFYYITPHHHPCMCIYTYTYTYTRMCINIDRTHINSHPEAEVSPAGWLLLVLVPGAALPVVPLLPGRAGRLPRAPVLVLAWQAQGVLSAKKDAGSDIYIYIFIYLFMYTLY